jgi:acid phosphatase
VGIVILENESYESIVGNPAMPYLNGLIAQGGLAKNYFANVHPSLPNYFMLTVGDLVTTINDYPSVVTADNVVRQLLASGKTWKSYLEGLPSAGYLGSDTGTYTKHHNPFAYLSDVVNNPDQAKNMVPLTQLSADVTGSGLPNYFFVVPDNTHNSHDCPAGMSTCTTADKLAVADQWLQANLAPVLSNAGFQASGVLVITFDESVFSDVSNGGGHVATVLVGTGVKTGFQSTAFYQHQSVLRLTLQRLGIQSFPGAAATAPEMAEFFQ